MEVCSGWTDDYERSGDSEISPSCFGRGFAGVKTYDVYIKTMATSSGGGEPHTTVQQARGRNPDDALTALQFKRLYIPSRGDRVVKFIEVDCE